MLALVGIPLGASSRKGGRSAAYVWGIFLSFFCYYLAYITLTGWRRPVASIAGAGMLAARRGLRRRGHGADRAHGSAGRPRSDRCGRQAAAFFTRIAGRFERECEYPRPDSGRPGGIRIVLFQLMDSYVLSNFLFYFVLWLAAFVTMARCLTSSIC